MSRVAVVGLGGVGGYICAKLTQTEHEVVGFARGEHLKKIQEHGLEIVEDTVTWGANIDAKEIRDADGYFDIVLFCVKSYDLRETYEKIASYIDENSVIVSFSNGVSNSEVLRSLSSSVVLDACVYILSHQQGSGVVRKKGKVFTAIFGGNEDATQKLSSLFEVADLKYRTPSDIKTAIWKKYIFISAFATLTTYYDKSIAYVYENHYTEVKGALNEIAQVALVKGIDISLEIEKSLEVAKNLPKDASTSMHLDFTNKKRDELDTLTAYIVREAQKGKVKVPLMQKMYEKLLKRHIV